MRDYSVDLLNYYQLSWLLSDNRHQERDRLLNSLQGALLAIPRRNLLILCGDFNTDLASRAPVVGPSPIRKPLPLNDDTHLLLDILAQHDLCAINTWAGHKEYTCVVDGAGTGKKFIDAIFLRRSHADPQSRVTKTCYSCPLCAASESASYHYPIVATVSRWWRCWIPSSTNSPSRCPTHTSQHDIEMLQTAARSRSEQWLLLEQSVSAMKFEPEQVNARIRDLLLHHFPPSQAVRSSKAPSCDDFFERKWKVARALRQPAGAGLHAIFQRWRLVTRLKILHRLGQRRSRQIRRDKLNEIVDTAREAAKNYNMRALYHAVRRLSPKKPRVKVRFTSPSGLALSSSDEYVQILDYFRKLFVKDDATDWNIPYCANCPLTEADLLASFKSLKTWKAVPRHYLPTAVWKLLGDVIVPPLL